MTSFSCSYRWFWLRIYTVLILVFFNWNQLLNREASIVFATIDSDAPEVNPSQLLIATIIDPSNDEIIRDAFTLIRSMRLFGGHMNEATFLVGITSTAGEAFIDHQNLITELLELSVEITFVREVQSPLAKTLNKFRMFQEFDSIRFNYFLWLDADILIFNNPMKYLRMHSYPGRIDCVLDLYSYLRRYPSINTTAAMFHPSLAVVELLGENEITSHATCNTGVLYFDSISLQKFLYELSPLFSHLDQNISNFHPEDVSITSLLHQYGTDRFIDSLIFVFIINRIGLNVNLLSYEMNYMPFFEIELQQEMNEVNHIIFAHLVDKTAIYCNIINKTHENDQDLIRKRIYKVRYDSRSHDCICQYQSKQQPAAAATSLMRDYVNALLEQQHYCLVLAGAVLPTGYLHIPIIENMDFNVNDVIKCEVIFPSKEMKEWFIRISNIHDKVLLNIFITCETNINSIQDLLIINKILLNNNEAAVPALARPAAGAAAGGVMMKIYESSIEFHLNHTGSNCIGYTIEFSMNSIIKMNQVHNNYPIPMYNLSLEISMILNKLAMISMKQWDHRMKFSIIINNEQPSGQISYEMNLLRGTKSIALESQLLLVKHLNDYRIIHGIGIILCCNTIKGFETTLQLIQDWNGNNLLIILFHITLDHIHLMEHLTKKCNNVNRKMRCYIVNASEKHPSIFLKKLASSHPYGKIDFLYNDVMESYLIDPEIWVYWFKVLRGGGVLMGSGYQSQGRKQLDWCEEEEEKYDIVMNNNTNIKSLFSLTNFNSYHHHNNSSLASLRFRSSAVEAVVERLTIVYRQPPLLTYNELHPYYCDALLQKWNISLSRRLHECSPAWYLHKQLRI